jgi:DNA segregation ATPase FtsK/SpoIIIE, S-DNA-T family
LQAYLLRLLATHPPGKVRFVFLDVDGSGANAAAFMGLRDYDPALVTEKAYIHAQEIEDQLTNLLERIETINQTCLRGQYASLDAYNRAAGEITEPYYVLVVFGFPINFTKKSADDLIKIVQNGPRCGITSLVVCNAEAPPPVDAFSLHNFSFQNLNIEIIISTEQHFIWQGQDFQHVPLYLDEPPSSDLITHILQEVGLQAKAVSKVEVHFAPPIIPPPERWWQGNTTEGIAVALGRLGATGVQRLEVGASTGSGAFHHVLVVGKSGFGKTSLLHVLITNAALTYSPDELEFYLLDFKAVSFTVYDIHRLPHAQVVASHSDREFGLSVLQELTEELTHRKNLFSETGRQLGKSIQGIGDYRHALPASRMPRILLVLDEFQELFIYDDELAQQATSLLRRLILQGRSFGIHVVLASQSLALVRGYIGGDIIGQIGVRVVLHCQESDSRLALSDDNVAAQFLSRPGEAIYNTRNGLPEGNKVFQCAWLPGDILGDYLQSVQQFALRKSWPVQLPIVFAGNQEVDISCNEPLMKALAAPSWLAPQGHVSAWLGDPIAIKKLIAADFRFESENNLIIVGQQEEPALSMIASALISLAAQQAPKAARFYVLDFSLAGTSYAGFLERVCLLLPHTVQFVGRRGLPRVINEIAIEVEHRIAADERRGSSSYLFICGLQRARDLYQDESIDYSESADITQRNPAKQFATILQEGPERGVHTLVWCDTFANLGYRYVRCHEPQSK